MPTRMNSSSVSPRIIAALILVLLTFLTVDAAQPPIRSTRYNGVPEDGVNYGSNLAYDSSVAITIEAWAYRDEGGGCRTIVGRNSAVSYWFGFCGNRLRFYRSGGRFADSHVDVFPRQWTHVAVSYDGTSARFYVDGFPAGSSALTNDGANKPESLWLGRSPSDRPGEVHPFRGYLDEVRIWMRPVPPIEILRNMYREVTAGLSFVFVAPEGGTRLRGQVLGILPRDLIVPKASLPVTMDGNVNVDGEYTGAEQMIIRYRDGSVTADAVAYLVYRAEGGDQNLYIGVKPIRDTRPRWPRSNSSISVQVDPDHSQHRFAAAGDFQIQGKLNGDPGAWTVGNGSGGHALPAVPPSSTLWQVAYSYFDTGEFVPPTMEFRIARSVLGDWNQTDGLMIVHLHVGGSGDNYSAPGDSRSGEPSTWANVTYGDTIATPLANIEGAVLDRDNMHPIPGHRVSLMDATTGALLYTQNTDRSGMFSFSTVAVPARHNLKVQIAECDNCRYRNPITYEGIAPVATHPREVTYPGSVSGTPTYATIDFILLKPPPPITITNVAPDQGTPKVRVNETLPPLPGTTVRLSGANFHDWVEPYFFERDRCLEVPPLSDCQLDRNYFKADVKDRAPDGSWLDVEIPAIPARDSVQVWYVGLWDQWDRPGVSGSRAVFSSWIVSPYITVTAPEYPQIHGFRFKNADSTRGLTDFEGVFGNNARLCVVWFFGCHCHALLDPYYVLYLPFYVSALSSVRGNCNGMASTSLLFRRRVLNPSSFTRGAYFAAGLPAKDPADPNDTRAPRPPDYTSYHFCEPLNPTNLWAYIEVNHGVQMSDEYIQTVLGQMTGAGVLPTSGERVSSISGNPRAVLERVRTHPTDYLLAVVPELGKGHVVTPYAVSACIPARSNCSRIKVYDNNFPRDNTRYIEIDTTANTYVFPTDAATYTGNGLYTLPISLWTHSRSAPGIEAARRLLSLVIFGDADGLYTAPDGGQWGWRPDGSVVDELRGARAIAPLGDFDSNTRNVSLNLPVTSAPPAIQINVRGSHYYFHTAYGGQIMQVENLSGTAGDRDQVSLSYQDNRLSSFRFTPQRPAANFIPKIAMALSDQERAVFLWKGLHVSGGSSIEFKSLPSQRGVELKNDNTTAVNFELVAYTIDARSGTTTTHRFGPFEVPRGASHKVVFNDWPAARQLRSSVDRNRDGTFETVVVVNGRPVISNVSAASYNGPGLAEASIVTALGEDLTTTSATAAAASLPTELGGSIVEVRDSANKTRSAPLFSVSPSQIVYQMPAGTAHGTASVTIVGRNGTLAIGSVQVVSVAPGLFTANADGKGVAAGQLLRVKADKTETYEPLAQFDPQQQRSVARQIELGSPNDQVFLILSGTGIRNRKSLNAVTASIGGVGVEVLYAGEERGSPGRDQVKLRLPRSLAGRGNVDVSLVVEGKPANIVTLKIK